MSSLAAQTEPIFITACLQREEFDARKKAAEEAKASKLRNAPKKLASADKDLSHFPFLHNLAEREVMRWGERAGRIAGESGN